MVGRVLAVQVVTGADSLKPLACPHECQPAVSLRHEPVERNFVAWTPVVSIRPAPAPVLQPLLQTVLPVPLPLPGQLIPARDAPATSPRFGGETRASRRSTENQP